MYEFTSELLLWEGGDAPWHFVTLPEEISDEIEFRTAERTAGFGSVRVEVTVGTTSWRTSLFPDTSRGAYVLPVKKEARDREDLVAGDKVVVTLALEEDWT
ncbi:MAG TPA: DUF1905 domain-containing protein [Nitriliruptorales bacterium]